MAKKPKQASAVEGAETSPLPIDETTVRLKNAVQTFDSETFVFSSSGQLVDVVAIRITKDGVHDGLGGVWSLGQIARLPRETADIFIAKNCGVPADDASIVEAKKKAAETLAKVEASSAKAGAQARLRSYDDAPKSVRDLAKEFGDEVVARWEQGDSEEDILGDYGT